MTPVPVCQYLQDTSLSTGVGYNLFELCCWWASDVCLQLHTHTLSVVPSQDYTERLPVQTLKATVFRQPASSHGPIVPPLDAVALARTCLLHAHKHIPTSDMFVSLEQVWISYTESVFLINHPFSLSILPVILITCSATVLLHFKALLNRQSDPKQDVQPTL